MGIFDFLRRDSSDRDRPETNSAGVRIIEIDGAHSLTFVCGEQPVDNVVVEAGHEPNGYFWEGVATLVRPDLTDRIELDSEGGMFAASGALDDLNKLRESLQPLLTDADAIRALIRQAEERGFEFDD